MNKIEKIIVYAEVDCNPDISWMGEYSNVWKEGCIDRQERGDMGRNEYRYFHPAEPDYAEENYKRMEALCRGDWCFYGITAEATVSYQNANFGPCKRLEWLKSGGIWGVESDGGEEYLNEMVEEQIVDLKEHLSHFNVDLSNFDELTKDIELQYR